MPFEIKDKRTKEFRANALMCRTTRCGHCDYPILDDTTFLVFDEPYFCAIHNTCLTSFQWNGLNRGPAGDGRKEARVELDEMQKVLHEMVSRPWWQKSSATRKYHAAMSKMLAIHHSLRLSGVIGSGDDKDDDDNKEHTSQEEIKMTQEQLKNLVGGGILAAAAKP